MRMNRVRQLAVLVIAVLLALPSAQGLAAPVQDRLVVGIRNWDYDTFDPHVSNFTQSSWVFSNVFDPLIWLGPDRQLHPGLATQWRAENDARAWVLSLRSDVKFHDGTPFNAQVVKFNFDRMVDPNTKSKAAEQLMGPYAGTDILDANTVRVRFDKPFTLFPYNLSSAFMSMVSMEAVRRNPADFARRLIGSGPYRFLSENPKVETQLQRFNDYAWGPRFAENRGTGPAQMNRISFRFIQENEPRLTALRTGEAHLIDEVPPASVEELRASRDYSIHVVPRYGIARAFHFNTQIAPTNDIALRRGIVHAIDRTAIVRTLFRDTYPVTHTMVVPGTRYYDQSLEAQVAYNPGRARQILEEGGWRVGAGGIREKGGQRARVILATFPGFVAEAPAELVQAQLKEVGVEMVIQVMDGGAMMTGMARRDSQFNMAFIGTYDPDPTPLFQRIYHSANVGQSVFSHYTSPHLDRLIDTAAGTTDDGRKAAALREIQKIMVDQALGVGVYANASLFAARSQVQGLVFDLRANPWLFNTRLR
ncbi:MAG: hypothetical protein FJX78_04305 [Armatimonadetes bacterium]|nr:hypothetical protein [Armatimonadota bacterium]